jgi:progressive ankylosis protein
MKPAMKPFIKPSIQSPTPPNSEPTSITLLDLWREFLPLSLSDVTMACGDPLQTTTLAHLPDARTNIAAVGIARSIAIFFESPIIMILHASNALAPNPNSRKALWRFVLLTGSGLSALLVLISLPFIFAIVGDRVLGIPPTLLPIAQQVLLLMGPWAGAIAWRRYFQGLLIHHGQAKAVAQASLWRLGTVAFVLGVGFLRQAPGGILAGLAMVSGAIVEAIVVTIAARKFRVTDLPAPPTDPKLQALPTNLRQVVKFYLPLANSMMVVWGGRVLLVGILARSQDSALALAAWTACWGLVSVIANSTRMVQQMIIKYRHQVSDRQLLKFTLTVGLMCSFVLFIMGNTPMGGGMMRAFVGNDRDLVDNIRPVLQICTWVPLLVALQNATQGFLVSAGRTGTVNFSTWLGTGTLLLVATIGVSRDMSGALAAGIATVFSLSIEITCLFLKSRVPG